MASKRLQCVCVAETVANCFCADDAVVVDLVGTMIDLHVVLVGTVSAVLGLSVGGDDSVGASDGGIANGTCLCTVSHTKVVSAVEEEALCPDSVSVRWGSAEVCEGTVPEVPRASKVLTLAKLSSKDGNLAEDLFFF